jgi:hypothetical protein
MAIADKALTESEAGAVSSHTFSHTCTAGTDPALFVRVGHLLFSGPTQVITGITYNGVAMTKIGDADIGSGNFEACELWGLIGPDTGAAHDVVISYDRTVTASDAAATSWTGVDSTTAWDGVQTNTGTGSTLSVTVTTMSAGDIVLDVICGWPNSAFVAGADQTKDFDTNPGSEDFSVAGSTQAGADGGVMSWTGPDELFALVAANVRAATGGGGSGIAVLRRRIEGD